MIFQSVSDKWSEEALKAIAQNYIDLDLLTSGEDVDAIMEKAWKPIASSADVANSYDVTPEIEP